MRSIDEMLLARQKQKAALILEAMLIDRCAALAPFGMRGFYRWFHR